MRVGDVFKDADVVSIDELRAAREAALVATMTTMRRKTRPGDPACGALLPTGAVPDREELAEFPRKRVNPDGGVDVVVTLLGSRLAGSARDNRSGTMATRKQLKAAVLARRAAKGPRKKRTRPEPRQYTVVDLERARDRVAAAERRIDNDRRSNPNRGRAGLERAQLVLSVIESQLRSRGLLE